MAARTNGSSRRLLRAAPRPSRRWPSHPVMAIRSAGGDRTLRLAQGCALTSVVPRGGRGLGERAYAAHAARPPRARGRHAVPTRARAGDGRWRDADRAGRRGRARQDRSGGMDRRRSLRAGARRADPHRGARGPQAPVVVGTGNALRHPRGRRRRSMAASGDCRRTGGHQSLVGARRVSRVDRLLQEPRRRGVTAVAHLGPAHR